MPTIDTPLLNSINHPDDLKLLSISELKALADELRQFIIHSVAQTGGHLAAGLGTIELTIVLHYLYNTPDDHLIWDVGHQSYPHKILTGRRDQMHTIRQKNGLSGFPKREESEFDHFGVGHSSTSISAALGFAMGDQYLKSGYSSVAIIGDGGMSGGMAFEALNHAGATDADILVILNDNEMSISPNVGALSKYLSRILSGSIYASMRENSKRILQNIPSAWELARRTEEHIKGMVVPGTLFEGLGFSYYGPIDGHDIDNLIKILGNLKKIKGPKLLHVVTKKGMGYEPAELDSCKFHGVGPFDVATGAITKTPSDKKSYTQIFSDWIVKKGQSDKQLHVITPAMREGSGLVKFSQVLPDQYHDVAIAEQHAVTFAASMSLTGIKPIVAIYSTFLQRAYDQYIHDIAIQNCNVLFAVDRAGIVGADGATHTGNFDISFLRCIPNTIIMAPSNGNELQLLLNTGYAYNGPAFVRYPRDTCQTVANIDIQHTIPIGTANTIRQGKKAALLVFGTLLEQALIAAEATNISLVDMRFVMPLDEPLLKTMCQQHDVIITLEDNTIAGGAGSAVMQWMQEHNFYKPCITLGLIAEFPHHATREQIFDEYGLNSEQLIKTIRRLKKNIDTFGKLKNN